MNMNSERKYPGRWPLLIAIILLWLARPLMLLLPESRTWGFNHLLFLPMGYTIAYISLGIIGGLFFVPSVRLKIDGIAERVGVSLLGRPRYLLWGGLSLVAVIFFWFFRMPTHLLGDGYSVINNIGGTNPVLFKWSEAASVRIVHAVSLLVPFEGLKRGEYAYALISVFSGGLTLFFYFCIAYHLVETGSGRLLTACLLLFGGSTLLFFGYAENYPLLWLFVSGYLYFSLRYMRGIGRLLWPAIFLAAGLILHLQILFFAVSFPILVFAQGRGLELFQRFKRIILISGGVALTAILIFLLYRYNQALEFQVHFVPPFGGRPGTPDYWLISPQHLLDIINELSLLIPLWPVLLLLSGKAVWRGRRDAIMLFVSLFALGGLALLFIIDPRLGMGRDWDMYALCGLGLFLPLAMTIAQGDTAPKRYLPSLLYFSLLLTLPFYWTNLQSDSSLLYVESLLRLDISRGRAGHVSLRNYYRDSGDRQRADSVNAVMDAAFPRVVLLEEVTRLARAKKLDEALALADSLRTLEPYSAEVYNASGMAAFESGDYAKAREYFEQSARLMPENHRIHINLSMTYQRLELVDHAIASSRQVLKLAPNSYQAMISLAGCFMQKELMDSSLWYSRWAIQIDSTAANAYILYGIAAFRLGRNEESKAAVKRFIAISPQGPERRRAEEFLKTIP